MPEDQAEDLPPEEVDPHAMHDPIAALSDEARADARASLAVLAVTMRPSEQLECVAQGRFNGANAVAALTDQRVLLVSEREWSPEVLVFEIGIDLVVQGLQDDRTASLTFIGGGLNQAVTGIVDRPIAHDLARLIRARVAELGR